MCIDLATRLNTPTFEGTVLPCPAAVFNKLQGGHTQRRVAVCFSSVQHTGALLLP